MTTTASPPMVRIPPYLLSLASLILPTARVPTHIPIRDSSSPGVGPSNTTSTPLPSVPETSLVESLFLPVQKQIATRLQDQDLKIARLETNLLAEQEKNRKLKEERVVDAQKAKDDAQKTKDNAQKTKAAELEAAAWKSKFEKLKAKRDEARAKHNSYIAEDPDLD